MNDRIPRTKHDHVLVDVKAKPSGWPAANLDPDSGRGPQATSGTPAEGRIRQNQVSTLSGDCRELREFRVTGAAEYLAIRARLSGC